MDSKKEYIDLLPEYFSGSLSKEDCVAVEEWKNASEENLQIFQESEKVYRSINLLTEMKHYNSTAALQKLDERISKEKPVRSLSFYWQRVAAILVLPLLLASIYFYYDRNSSDQIVWQACQTPSGVKSQLQLPDGTSVFLNSDTEIEYPSIFSGNERRVILKGEAFFNVVKDASHPFIVDAGKIGIEVKGTRFNVMNYAGEDKTEVVLAEGKVNLIEENESNYKTLAEMKPGERAVFKRTEGRIQMQEVNVDQYIGWIDGLLIFRDDPMAQVARTLERWYNVDITIENQEINNYIFTGTFKHETITQVLDLLKRTSPFDYYIVPGEKQQNGIYEKQKIIITKSSK